MQLTSVEKHGTIVEKARLIYLLNGTPPSKTVIHECFAGQNKDGGWPAKWSHELSSLDATCFHLAQAEQLGLTTSEKPIQEALRFLVRHQSLDGSWDKDAAVSKYAPRKIEAWHP